MFSLSARVFPCGGEGSQFRAGGSSFSSVSSKIVGHRFALGFFLLLGVFGLPFSHTDLSGVDGSIVGVIVAPRFPIVDGSLLGEASSAALEQPVGTSSGSGGGCGKLLQVGVAVGWPRWGWLILPPMRHWGIWFFSDGFSSYSRGSVGTDLTASGLVPISSTLPLPMSRCWLSSNRCVVFGWARVRAWSWVFEPSFGPDHNSSSFGVFLVHAFGVSGSNFVIKFCAGSGIGSAVVEPEIIIVGGRHRNGK